MIVEQQIREAIKKALAETGLGEVSFVLEVPADLSHGDLATNVALIAGKTEGKNPKELAEELKEKLSVELGDVVREITIAGPGFINFHLSRDVFVGVLKDATAHADSFGSNDSRNGEKVMVEYTDPNPFKEFHIGHLMSNAIGESFSRLIENSGADVKRANYQGDVGVHVAQAVWGRMQQPELSWGEAYALGANSYADNKEEIDALNKTIYERSDEKVNALYDQGRKETLEMFEDMYALLGTHFDEYFFESEVAQKGKEIVEENVPNVFEESDGAVVYQGEKDGLHTRVFLNSEGLPTYEAKELALPAEKYNRYPYDTSIVVTGNEINEYFKVLMSALGKINPELADKTQHVGHGMLRLPEGKMSSRTGDVVAAEDLITRVKDEALSRMEEEDGKMAEQIAIAALKYAILKQAPGKDVVFDINQAISFEGDSGPYLQYTFVRTQSLLEKGKAEGVKPSFGTIPESVGEVERILLHFPSVAGRAADELAPQQVVHYLLSLASAFNSWYAKEKIVDADDALTPYKLAVTQAVGIVMKRGLWLLGIEAPQRM